MALNGTTLSAPIDANQLDIPVTSATGFSAGRFVKIEDEYAVVTKVVNLMVTLRSRGDNGTTARAHNILAPVVAGDATDFQTIPPARHRGQIEQINGQVSYGASGAIAVPDKDTDVVLNGASAQAMTIADPTRLQDGIKVRIVSTSAAAHTLTNTTGFNAGGAAFDVGTFAGAVGNYIILEAQTGRWVVIGTAGVTLA